MASPYGSDHAVLVADRYQLETAFLAHTTRHRCPDDGKCKPRRELAEVLRNFRRMEHDTAGDSD